MQRLDNGQIENESDNDEGFIPSKNIINEKEPTSIKKQQPKSQQQRKQFLPRYILQGIMRKQPTQCHQRFMRFDYVQNSGKPQGLPQQDYPHQQDYHQPKAPTLQQKQQKPTSKQKQKLMTPYDKYIESGCYSMVYSRYRDFRFSNEEINFASNHVRLDCVRGGEEAKIKTIKPFEIIEDKNQEVISSSNQNHQNGQKSTTYKETILKFDSRFQCGNLLCAFKHKQHPHTYTLFIQNDTNTYGYNHWFYFSVKNAQPGVKYRFHIVNFRKRHSFFRQGNTPVVFSLADSRREGMSGYSKRGEDVRYGKSGIVKDYDSKERFFRLEFGLEFWNDGDVYYVSAGLPYSYSKLLKNLSIYEEMARTNRIRWVLESVGTSIGGNNIPYVTITKFQDELQEVNVVKTSKSYRESAQSDKHDSLQGQHPRPKLKHNYSQHCRQNTKRTIFLTARQHPGETWSSYLMDQFIYALVAQSTPQAKYLLDNFVVKCIPMINVDGVISGNFRCDLTGMDLNRNWKNPSALLHPQIFSIKSEIQTLLQKGHQIDVFFDLHGHSKEYNLFCYSCKTDNFQCRLLPYILSQYNQEFYFPFCTFGVSRYKMSTARAVVFSMTRNPNVLTIESSFFGSKIDGKVNIFEPQNFKRIAASLIKACKSYFSQDQRYHNCKQIIKERIAEFMSYKGEDQNPALSGSDSQPSGDQIEITEKLDKILPKTVIQSIPQLQEMKKAAKKAKKKAKKLAQMNSEQLQSDKEKAFSFIKSDTIEVGKNQNAAKATVTNWQTIRIRKTPEDEKNKTINFKNRSFMMSSKAIDEDDAVNSSKGFIREIIDRQQHKLPFFSRQRHGMVPMRLKNQSLQIFKDAYNATQKPTKPRYQLSLDDVHSQRRFTTKKLTTIYKDQNQKNKSIQDLPILCVLSQNKRKRQQMQITQQEVHPQSRSYNSSHNKVKTAIQARTEAIKNLRERNKNGVDLVSKIWRENIQRYGKAFSAFRIDND